MELAASHETELKYLGLERSYALLQRRCLCVTSLHALSAFPKFPHRFFCASAPLADVSPGAIWKEIPGGRSLYEIESSDHLETNQLRHAVDIRRLSCQLSDT